MAPYRGICLVLGCMYFGHLKRVPTKHKGRPRYKCLDPCSVRTWRKNENAFLNCLARAKQLLRNTLNTFKEQTSKRPQSFLNQSC
eukprot:4151641-Amphidinium_carterae.1